MYTENEISSATDVSELNFKSPPIQKKRFRWLRAILIFIILLGLFPIARFLLGPYLYSLIYNSPSYERLVENYVVDEIFFSPNTPYALFNSFDGGGGETSLTGLVNLHSREIFVLAETNFQDSRKTHFFSPDGKKVLYRIITSKKNEYPSYDLYLYDISTNKSQRISTDEYKLEAKRETKSPYFGWINDSEISYHCDRDGYRDYAFCLADLNTQKISRNAFEEETASVVPKFYDNGFNTPTNFYSPVYNRDKSSFTYTRCVIRGYDGCAIMILRLKTPNDDKFLLRRDQGVWGGTYWTYDNQLFVRPEPNTEGRVKGLFKLL